MPVARGEVKEGDAELGARFPRMAQYATIPFYVGFDIPNLCPGVVTEPFPRSYADPYK